MYGIELYLNKAVVLKKNQPMCKAASLPKLSELLIINSKAL